MKIEYLKEFLELSNNKSYSKTAEKLFVSQSTLSKHIASVEAEVGSDILNHDSYGIEFTEFGRYALDEFAQIVHIYDGVMQRAERERSGKKGELVIGILYYQSEKLIRPILDFFQQAYPEIKLRTISGQPDQIFDALDNEHIDIAFLFHNPAFMSYDQDKFDVLPVFTERIIALCTPDSPLNNKKHKIKLADLAGQKLLRNEAGIYMKNYNDSFENYLQKKNIILSGSALLENVDFLSSRIMVTNSFLIQAKHIRDFHKNLGYAEITDLPVMNTCIFTKHSSTNPSIPVFKSIIPKIKAQGLFPE